MLATTRWLTTLSIYLTSRFLLKKTINTYVPGVPTSATSQAGIYLIEEEFEIAVWSRLYLDQGIRSTHRYAHATLGVLKVMSEVRAGLLNHVLSFDSDHNASLPITFESGSRLFESPEQPGWCRMSDTYKFGYEIA